MPEGTVVEAQALESAEASAETPKITLDEALKRLADHEAEASKNAALLTKLRKFERENAAKAEKEAVEAGKYRELYEASQSKLVEFESKIRNQAVDGALKDALAEAKVKSLTTALKLIDRAQVTVHDDGSIDPKSVSAAIKALQVSDPLVFGDGESAQAVAGINNTTQPQVRTVVVPPIHKAGEGATKDAFRSELDAAKTLDQVKKVYSKWQGKI